MGTLANKIIGAVVSIIILLIVLSFIFPDKISVKPVFEESKLLLKKAKQLFEDVPDESDIPTVKPIGDIPVIKLQSSGQSTDSNSGETIEVITDFDRYSQQAERDIEKTSDESESNNPEPRRIDESSTYPLDPDHVWFEYFYHKEHE